MPHNLARQSSTSDQKRKRFLTQLWSLFTGNQSSPRSRSQRLGFVESLEERRVLATLYAVDNANHLLTFDSATPGTISNNVLITGLQAGEKVAGIDTRPATGQLYALGLVDEGTARSGRIYTINPTSGVATQVGGDPWSRTLADVDFVGFNFNPNVDRIRITNREGGNFRVNPDTGALAGTDTNLSAVGINGVAYTNNDGFLSTTTLFGMDFGNNDLVTIGGLNGTPSPNGGQVLTVGDTGVNALDSYALEITSVGGVATAFATEDGNLHTVNLSTGALTRVGEIGGAPSIRGLSAAIKTLTVAGSAGTDTLVVNATGANSGTYVLNGGAPVSFSGITSFSFLAGADNDTLTINNPAGGLFAPVGGIAYHGGGQSGDSLNLLGGGGAGINQTYFVGTTTPPLGAGPGNSGDGLIRFTGASAVDIRFTGLAPIVDTVLAASLTVNSTDGANNISVTNGVSPRLVVAIDAFEPIEFNNKAQLIVNGGDGAVGGDAADNILLNFSNLPAGLAGITINADEGTDAVSVNNTAAGVPTNITTGAGNDSIVFANGASLNGGTVDGGADTDTVDYSAFATGVSVNLGLIVSGLSATLAGDQEVPANSSTASGTASVTNYNPATRTFDISVTVNDLAPASVTGFHIHRGAFGVNGPVIVDFGTGSLVASGTGFSFKAVGLCLIAAKAQDEAALLSGSTYVNVHTAAFPGGIIRGQLFSNGNVGLASGRATGTGGVAGIENAIGGSGADGLVGTFGVNSLQGNSGNDVLLGGPGNDNMQGGNDSDILVWSNGDNTDVIDGNAGTDIVSVNGAVAAGDVFTVTGAAGRVAFARTNLVPFGLDIGTAERLIINGVGGDDSLTSSDMSGVVDLTTLDLNGQFGNDTINAAFPVPAGLTVNVKGGPHGAGDTLSVDAGGGPLTDSGTQLSKTGLNPINYSQIENLSIANIGNLTITGSGIDDSLVVNATSANAGTYKLNAGPVIAFTGMTKLTFNSAAGSDGLTINNPAVGLFAPVGGIDYNGGGQAGDLLNLLGGGAADLVQTYFVGTTTPPIGVGPGNNGDGLLRFTGSSNVDIRFTGLAPIVDTVVAASLTVNSTDAANNISVTNGAAPRLIVAVDAFETIEFNNKAQLIVNGGDGAAGGDAADTILLNFSNLPAGLAGITINADEGADAISLRASSNVPVTLNGGDGLDVINVGNNGTLGTPGLLTPVAGPVIVNGGAGGANLTVDGTGAAVAADYAITATTVTRSVPSGFGGVTYSNLTTLLLATGSGPNVVTVSSTSVPTTADANAGIDTLILNPTNSISIYEQAGNYNFDLGTPGGLTALDFENINLLPGNGVLNIVGDEGQGTSLGGAGVDDTDRVEVVGTAQNAGGLRLNNIALPQIVLFAGVTNLNVSTFDLDDDVTLDPFASTTQAWNIVVHVNSGAGDDDIFYGNASILPVVDPIPNGSAAGVSENVTVTPTLFPGTGEIAVPGVVTIHFQETEDLSFQLNDGGLGDSDTLTIRGTNSNLSDVFTIRPDNAGDDLQPLVDLDVSAVQILQIENISAVAPGGAQFFVTAINFEGLGGSDTFDLIPGASGTILNIDGGNPTNNPLASDVISIPGTAAAADLFTVTPGATADAGAIASTISGTPRAAVSFKNLEGINLNLGGGAAADVLTMQGTGANNAFTLVATGVASGTARVDAGPLVTFTGLGTAGSDINLVGLGGDDLFSVTHLANWAVDDVNIDGGAPSASDAFQLSGTAGIDGFAYTATSANSGQIDLTSGGPTTNYILTSVESALVDGLAAVDTLNVTTPNAVIVPGSNAGEGTVKPVDNVGGALLALSYRSIETVTVTGAVAVIQGTEADDTIRISAAGIITVTNSLGFNNVVDVSGFASLVINALGGNDNVSVDTTFAGPINVIGGTGINRLTVNGVAAVAELFVVVPDVTPGSGLITANTAVGYTGISHVSLNANPNDDLVILDTAQNNTWTVGAAPLIGDRTQLDSRETIDYFGFDEVDLVATGGVDTFVIRPTGLTGSATPLVVFGGPVGSTNDRLVILGTAGNDAFVLNSNNGGVVGAQGTASLNGTSVIFGDIGAVELNGLAGNDNFDVTALATTSVMVDGSDPIGATGDTLILTVPAGAGTTTFVPGTENDEGGFSFTGAFQPVSFNNIEAVGPISLAAAGGVLIVCGTNAGDTMNIRGTGAAAVSVSVNGGLEINYTGVTTLNVQGKSGDDVIHVAPGAFTGILNVDGGDPTASDKVVVTGTAGLDNVVIDMVVIDGARVTGLGSVINVSTTENLVYSGLGGNDTLTVTSPAGGGTIDFITGNVADAGSVLLSQGGGVSLLAVSYQGVGIVGNIVLADAGGARADTLQFFATNLDDVVSVTAAGNIQAFNPAGGSSSFRTLRVQTPGVSSVILAGQDGDDVFNIPGNHPFTPTFGLPAIRVEGGNPSASDVLNFTSAGAAVTLNFGSSNIVETGFAPVVYSGVEIVNANAGTRDFTVNGTTGDDTLDVTPTGADSATFRLTKSNPSIGSTPFVNGSQIGTLSVNLLAGSDTLVVNGTTAGEAITVTGALLAVGALETVNFLGTEALSVFAHQGADTITVTPGAIPVFIDGGDPVGVLPGDVLIVNAAVGFFAGPETDEGGVLTGGGTVSFDHIESLVLAGIAGCGFLILGSNADDDITIIARDNSTTAGADGVQDMTFSINAGMSVVLLNQPDLFIDAMAGDDDVVIRTAAPNEAAWDVNVRVAGGSPSIGAPLEADRLVLETPNNAGGFDDVVFNPTGTDTGNMVIDENANGAYDAGGTDSIITFGSFIFDCPPAAFTYASTAGGVELIQYNGEGAPAVDDNFTINGTALDDTTILNPTGIGTGSFASGASPQFLFQSFDSVTVNSGLGGFDRVEIVGTVGPDLVTSNATTVTLGGAVTIGQGIDQLDVITFDGNDNVDLDLQLTSLRKVINLGAGNDTADLLGVIVDPADPIIYGGDGDDNIVGSPNADFIYGDSGTDVILGMGNIDYIEGGNGNDTITGGTGDDTLHGGDGSDVIIWNNGDNTDVVEGGTGDDRAVVNGAGAGDTFTVFADSTNPSRIAFSRTNLVPFALDIADIEELDVNSGNGNDNITVGDLTTTALRELDLDLGIEAGVSDRVTINSRNVSDNIQINGAGSVMTIAGLQYDIRVTNALATDQDDFTFNANSGNDEVVVADTVAGFFISAPDAAASNRFRIFGGDGDDSLFGYGALIGQAGNDTLVGSATIAVANGNQILIGGDGDDTMVGGAGNDTFDGGAGFDTILVRGTPGSDVIAINQSADDTLLETVNGTVETDTLFLLPGGLRTVERVTVQAGDGSDLIAVRWADALGTDASPNSLRVDVDGGAGSTADRLGVIDVGTGDLILFEQGTTADSGAMAVGPGNTEPLIVNFTNVEVAQPVAGNGGDVVFFKHDDFEYNDARTLATYLGSGDAINVDPNINPGLDPIFSLPGDEDWFRVVAERTGVLDFQVYFRQVGPVPSGRPGLPNSGNLDIAVTDAAGTVIAGFGANDATSDERVRIPAVAGQTYYLRVFANGAAINTYNVTVDNYTAPVPRDIELLDNPVGDPPPANSDTGRSQFDNVTRDNTPTLVFRLDDGILLNDIQGNSPAGNNPPNGVVIPIPFQAAAGAAGYRIAIFDEGSSPAPGTQAGTAPQVPLGFATFVSPGVYQFTTPVLNDGSHFLTARVQIVDPAVAQQTGFGERSVALEIVVDTVVPPGFFGQINLADTTQGLAAESDSGVVGDSATFVDRVTNDTTPSFYGRAEADAIVRVYAETNGVAGLQSTGAAPDLFLGLTAATPLDGTNQFPGGQWSFTTPLDLNNPNLGFAHDGARSLYMTNEDLAGNVTPDANADRLNIFLDTAGAQVTDVQITGSPLFNLFGLKPDNSIEGPTPRVDSLTIRVQDFPNRSNLDPNFLYNALQLLAATTPGNFVLRGDHSGIIAIESITFIGDPTANGALATGSIVLDFFAPLPDDRFTLTIKENVVDPVGNRFDGESNAAEPNGNPSFPSGDGQPGGDFVARFTVDSRPEIGAISEGIVYVDINGNMVWDPEGQDNDATNRDFTFQFGQLVDAHFAGNFAPVGAVAASGYDKLGAYGKFGGLYSFILDTNDDGVGDFSSLMPAAYQVNGIPVAGDFNAAHPGDEIGLFDGSFWYLDVNGNNQIDLGERIASNFNGLPVVGDFNGDGNDDLAVFVNDTNRFIFDTNRDGNSNFTWNVADQLSRFGGLSGFTDRPVAGDLNLDGIDDIGLWAKDRQGTLPRNSGEYFFWVSDRVNANPANVFDSFSPAPLGNDLSAEFGDELALPMCGHFDPGVRTGAEDSIPLHRHPAPLDISGDGAISPLDALLVINVLNKFRGLPTNDPVRAYFTIGQVKADSSGDRAVTPLDALLVINSLNRRGAGGEGEMSNVSADSAQFQTAADSFFAQLGDDSDFENLKKRRR